MSITLAVRGEYIQLDQALKAAGLCESGGSAHQAVDEGLVTVDGRTETRRRAKLHPGQKIDYAGQTVVLTGSA